MSVMPPLLPRNRLRLPPSLKGRPRRSPRPRLGDAVSLGTRSLSLTRSSREFATSTTMAVVISQPRSVPAVTSLSASLTRSAWCHLGGGLVLPQSALRRVAAVAVVAAAVAVRVVAVAKGRVSPASKVSSISIVKVSWRPVFASLARSVPDLT